MKLFVRISLVVLILAGGALLTLPMSWFPSFYDVRYMGIASIAGAITILIVPATLRVSKTRPGAEQKNRAADLFQFALALAIIGNALGDLGLYQLYKAGFEFDKLLHFSVSALGVFLIPIIVRERFGIPVARTLPFAFLVIVASGFGWEAYEYLVDHAWGTHIFGVNGLDVNTDTTFDLAWDGIGALVGSFIALLKIKYPGVARRR